MDALELASLEYRSAAVMASGYGLPLVVRWRVAYELWRDALDLPVFLTSLTQTGKFPLFTCAGCGFFGCAGYYVGIEHTAQHYVLQHTYGAWDKELQLSTVYAEIPWWRMAQIIVELSAAIAAIPRHYPHLIEYMGNRIPNSDQLDAALQVIRSRI
jgi:hypothetical protein